jgi:hypothetical protein
MKHHFPSASCGVMTIVGGWQPTPHDWTPLVMEVTAAALQKSKTLRTTLPPCPLQTEPCLDVMR